MPDKQIPDDTLHISPPFTAAGLNLMGPCSVQGMGGGVPKQTKVWGVLIICLRTKAVCILAFPGYDMPNFLTTYKKFTSIYGELALLVSD